MAVDRVIQELMDLIEPPDDGDQATPQSEFGANRSTGSTPHVGFDMNRGRGVQPHGRVRSPVYGRVKEIQPELGRVVIEEWDPVNLKPTGYDVEILHTQTRMMKPGDTVAPAQQIGTQGDVGAERGAFHAHVQVVRSDDRTRTPLNPMRHLFEYHHPGEPIPPLPQFEPQQVPPREKRGAAAQSGNQGQPAPSGAPKPTDAPAGAMSTQLPPGTPIPGAEGPTVIGGPGPLRPLVPPAPSRWSAPAWSTCAIIQTTTAPPELCHAQGGMQRVIKGSLRQAVATMRARRGGPRNTALANSEIAICVAPVSSRCGERPAPASGVTSTGQ
jgi:hypothetical protein